MNDSQNGTDCIGEEDSAGGNKISKPPGEPSQPKSGGYNLKSVLGWNEANFEAIKVGLHLEKGYSILFTIVCL